jgi:hypothetical protein
LKTKGALSFDAPLVAVGELDRIEAVVVDAAFGVEVAELAALVLVELSTVSVFVELPLVLEELTSFPPSPH